MNFDQMYSTSLSRPTNVSTGIEISDSFDSSRCPARIAKLLNLDCVRVERICYEPAHDTNDLSHTHTVGGSIR